MIVSNIFTVWIIYICVLIICVDISKKKMKINTWSLTVQMKTRATKKYTDVWDGIENKIKTINGGKEKDYEKNYVKIKFNSDDYLPLNKPLKLCSITKTIRSVLEEDGKLYPDVFLDDNLYELSI